MEILRRNENEEAMYIANRSRPYRERKREQGPALQKKKRPGFDRDAQSLFQMVSRLCVDRRWHGRRLRPCRPAAHFTDLEPHETPDRNIFAQLGDRLAD